MTDLPEPLGAADGVRVDARADVRVDARAGAREGEGDAAASATEDFRTTLTHHEIVFRCPDPQHELVDVRLWYYLDLPLPDGRRGSQPPPPDHLQPVPGGWELRWPLAGLDLDRLEYEFTAGRSGHPEGPDGRERTMFPDPGNPLRVEGPFSGSSWLALPGYQQPEWLADERWPMVSQVVSVPALRSAEGAHGAEVGDSAEGVESVEGVQGADRAEGGVRPLDVEVWNPAWAVDQELPLLIAHDGPEFHRLGALTDAIAAFGAAGRLPALRVALLPPHRRTSTYAADPAYATWLVEQAVPALREALPTRGRPILAGPSLGGLAALHAEWHYPGTFAGLLLLSGSFFMDEFDSHEAGFVHWARLRGFIDEVYAVGLPPSRPAVALGWGTAEENRHNNLAMAARLEQLGLSVGRATRRDGHTFTCWRNLLDPLLPQLVAAAWPQEG